LLKINGKVVGDETYPNGETIMYSDVGITDLIMSFELKFENDSDLFNLMMYKKYVDEKYPNTQKCLIMRYIPYSRMDRKIDGYIFSLKYFCQFINDLKFNQVFVLDPHSSMSIGLLNNVSELNISNLVNKAMLGKDIDYIFYPDAGACKRYSETLNLWKPYDYFYGNKKRNLQTGEIIDYELVDCPNIKGKNILIVDDLCSKGFTFYNAAQKLKQTGADKIYLYVSHCENSIYDGKLLIGDYLIERIYTTDSILTNFTSKKIVVL